MKKKMKKSVLGRWKKNRSKYNPQNCNKEQENLRRKRQIEKGILHV